MIINYIFTEKIIHPIMKNEQKCKRQNLCEDKSQNFEITI